MADLTKDPYYDDYDRNKKYTQILAVPEGAPQARETTQIQTMLLDFLERGLDIFLRDGDIIEGCSINIQGTSVSITPGKVYVQGLVHDTTGVSSASPLTITGTGYETVGIHVKETIVTELEDPTLKDPALGTHEFIPPGAHRLKKEIQWVVNDSTAIILYRMNNGSLLSAHERPEVDALTEVLARRTFEESENYRVRGLAVSMESVDDEMSNAVVSSGKAYILGYEVTKPAPLKVKVPLSRATRKGTVESEDFAKGTLDYRLNTLHVAKVQRLTGRAQMIEYLTRGSVIDGSDPFPRNNIVSIKAVNQGGDWDESTQSFTGGTTYVAGTDYQLTGNEVDWSLAGAEPGTGTSYQVVYTYDRDFVEKQDFNLVKKSDGYHYISWIDDSTGAKAAIHPVDASTFTITYDWYLERKDLLYMDEVGDIKLLQGQPNKEGHAKHPTVTFNYLPLARLHLPPNSKNISVTQAKNSRTTMKQIQNLADRITNLEYNLAITNLDQQAEREEGSTTQLSAIFTDGFYGFSKADISHIDYDIAMNLFTHELTIPVESILKELKLNSTMSKVNLKDRFYLTPYGETMAIEQLLASETLNINPYMVFNTEASVSLDPATDNWVDETSVTLPTTIELDNQVQVPAKFIDDWWTTESQRELLETLKSKENFEGESVKLFEQAETFMRSIPVTVSGTKFQPDTDVRLKFDGQLLHFDPTGTSVAGTPYKTFRTVKADANGNFSGTFTIPPNTPSGTSTVALLNDNSYAARPYTSVGFKRVYAQTDVDLVTNTQVFQDIHGTKNKLVQDQITDVVNQTNQNTENIAVLDERVTNLEARMSKVEDDIREIYGLLDEIARETDTARKDALIAKKDAEKANALAELSNARSEEADRKAEIALLISIMADRRSRLALAQANLAEQNAKDAVEKAETALQKADEAATLAENMRLKQEELSNNLADLETRTKDIENQVESDLENLQTQISNNQTAIQQNSDNISTIEGEISDLSLDVEGLNDQIANTNDRVDPLAQSFAFMRDTQIASIEVAFATKGTLPVNCQIRELDDGGYPTRNVIGEKVITPDAITTSADGSVMTKITFPAPVFCKADKDYCFVLITEDTLYELYTATLGEKDLVSQQLIGKQPFNIGVLFSSSNNISWTTHQKSDLKFRINRVSVTDDAILTFEDIPMDNISEVVLSVDQLIPSNATSIWEYQVNASTIWNPLEAYEKSETPELAKNLKLRCTVKSIPGASISPIVLRPGASVHVLRKYGTATYVSKNIQTDLAYNTVRQTLDVKLPSQTSYKVLFSVDDGLSWVESKQVASTQVSSEYARVDHEAKLLLPHVENVTFTPSTSGGSLGGGTYYYVVTALNANGETTGKEFTVTIDSTTTGSVSIDLSSAFPKGYDGVRIYRGTTAGGTSLKYAFDKSTDPLPTNMIVVDDGTDPDAATTTPPTENTATYTATQFRSRIELSTQNLLFAPRVKRFVNVMRV